MAARIRACKFHPGPQSCTLKGRPTSLQLWQKADHQSGEDHELSMEILAELCILLQEQQQLWRCPGRLQLVTSSSRMWRLRTLQGNMSLLDVISALYHGHLHVYPRPYVACNQLKNVILAKGRGKSNVVASALYCKVPPCLSSQTQSWIFL